MTAAARTVTADAARLRRYASALLVVTSVLFGAAVVVGVALVALSDAKGIRITGAVMATGGLIAWLTAAVFCAACRALASYISRG